MAAFATRIGPFMKKDVAACLEQAAERGVDAGLLIDVVRRGPLPLMSPDEAMGAATTYGHSCTSNSAD